MERYPEKNIDAADQSEQSRGLAPHRLSRVITFIDANLGEKIPVQELAGLACMSAFHFSRMFKLSTGVSPHRYISLRRLELAKHLLESSELPIADVAKAAGFTSQSHLTAIFKASVGVPPGRFRVQRAAASLRR